MLHLIVNPVAGNGRAQKIARQAEEKLKALNVPYTLEETCFPGHATHLAGAYAQSEDTVAAVGGDGTILEVSRALIGAKASLGVIPAGTGNDVVKMLGIPSEPLAALDHLLSHPARPLDAGRYNDSFFLNVSGVGFDVMVLDYALEAKKYVRGLLPYLYGVIRTIFTYRPFRLSITLDNGETRTLPLLIAAVANGRFFGGGIEIAPQSRPDDGLFDVILVRHLPRWRLPFQLPRLLLGKVMNIPGAEHYRCRSMRVTSDAPLRVDVDGEILPCPEVAYEILPGALKARW